MDITRSRKRQVFLKGEVKGVKEIGPQLFCPKGPPIPCGNLFPITTLFHGMIGIQQGCILIFHH